MNDRLVFNAVADFETKASYSVRVRAIDRAGLSTEQVFTVDVRDANEAPIQLILSRAELEENDLPNALVGMFSAIDRDANSYFTYQLVAGLGDTDNDAFTIEGTQLHAIDFETKSNYSIRVRVTDSFGLSREEILSISILDRDERPLLISLV